jgi:hypothetical protein
VSEGPRTREEFLLTRAHRRCEYCHLPLTRRGVLGPQMDHIVARQHGGGDELENLAIACIRCNLIKGPNLTSIDPITGKITRLFNPRKDEWQDHFEIVAARIQGRTAVGRTTAFVLEFNGPATCIRRQTLMETGVRFD